MDAFDISEKLKYYWMMLIPKHSGEIVKSKEKIKVIVNTSEGLREVVGVHVHDNMIELELDKE